MSKPVFNVRIEEVPVIGGFISNSLVRDVSSFIPYSDFDAPFPANFAAQVLVVRAAVSPVVIQNQMKLVTFNLLTGMYAMRENMNKAEAYFISAGSSLNVLPKDMGQRAVRRAIGRGDVEALIQALGIVNTNIANNSAALIAKGFTLVKQTALVTATQGLDTNNTLQNTLYQQRSVQASTNMALYNDFWLTYVLKTSKIGTLIFKVSDKTKVKDYMVNVLKKRIRNDQAQTDVYGIAKDSAGNVLNKAKIKLIPVDGGRTKTVYTDATGAYKMNGMRATDYNMVATWGALSKVVPVTVATRDHLEVNVVLA